MNVPEPKRKASACMTVCCLEISSLVGWHKAYPTPDTSSPFGKRCHQVNEALNASIRQLGKSAELLLSFDGL